MSDNFRLDTVNFMAHYFHRMWPGRFMQLYWGRDELCSDSLFPGLDEQLHSGAVYPYTRAERQFYQTIQQHGSVTPASRDGLPDQHAASSDPVLGPLLWLCLPEALLPSSRDEQGTEYCHFPLGTLDGAQILWGDGWLNFCFTPRSALLFATWGAWLLRRELPEALLESPIALISVRLSHERVSQGLAAQSIRFWNRCYMDYFLCFRGHLHLNTQELHTMSAYRSDTTLRQAAEDLFYPLPHRRRSHCGHFYRHMHIPVRWPHAASWR